MRDGPDFVLEAGNKTGTNNSASDIEHTNTMDKTKVDHNDAKRHAELPGAGRSGYPAGPFLNTRRPRWQQRVAPVLAFDSCSWSGGQHIVQRRDTSHGQINAPPPKRPRLALGRVADRIFETQPRLDSVVGGSSTGPQDVDPARQGLHKMGQTSSENLGRGHCVAQQSVQCGHFRVVQSGASAP